ncbi:MAG: hypothetical protein ACYS8W_11430 [Planctomycetota bacterium]|jgi:hypothetical protein
MSEIPLLITIIAFIEAMAGVFAVGVAFALIAQEIMRRLDRREIRFATTRARLVICLGLIAGIALESWLVHRAWDTLVSFDAAGGGALPLAVSLAAGPAAVLLLILVSYFALAPEAACRTASKSVASKIELRFRENVIPVPLVLAAGCVPVAELANGTVVFLVSDCPDRPAQRLLRKKLGMPVRYARAREKRETAFLKNFYLENGADYRPVVFEKENFLESAEAIERISSGARPEPDAAAACIPKDRVLLVETDVRFYSRRIFSIDPAPVFATDYGISYWPYMKAALDGDGQLVLVRHFTRQETPEAPGLLIFENRVIDGDNHGHGIRLVDPREWVAFAPPSDYQIVGVDDSGNLVIEIAGKARTIQKDSCPAGPFSEDYFLLARGRILHRRLRLTVRDFHLIPRDRIVTVGPGDSSPPALHEKLELKL